VNNFCDPGTTSRIKSSALTSDMGWVIGGVLLGTGAGFVLFSPSGHHEPAAAVRLAPVVAANGAGILATGDWW
jgi:hypothetical protein